MRYLAVIADHDCFDDSRNIRELRRSRLRALIPRKHKVENRTCAVRLNLTLHANLSTF